MRSAFILRLVFYYIEEAECGLKCSFSGEGSRISDFIAVRLSRIARDQATGGLVAYFIVLLIC